MQIIAEAKNVRISPRKIRLIADSIRKMSIDQALQFLAVINKRGATILEKTLKSAVANALNNAQLTKDSLTIKSIQVTEGQSLKRYRPSTRGRIHPYKRRASHVKIILSEKGGKNNGTKG